MKYTAIRGMEDILPQDMPKWQRIESLARKHLESYGCAEIRTPIVEETSLFVRGIGDGTDIVTKEMYTFSDRKGRSLTLRPEGTASVVRAFIEHSLQVKLPEARLYYLGPMFRSERPQKGRQRQFHQIGVEVIGMNSPYADAEVIIQLSRMLELFGLKDFMVKLNSLGCAGDKEKFAESLRAYFKGKEEALCDDCKTRITRNVLRILDCKKESCRALFGGAPDVSKQLCPACDKHFETLKKILTGMGIRFTVAKHLVRGLDYYTQTVFEVVHTGEGLGSQDALAAGGRYDNLVKDLGGPALGAVGYAIGVERVIMALGGAVESRPLVGIVTMGDAAAIAGIKLADELRRNIDIRVVTDIREASLKSQLRTADSYGAKAVLIIGDNELGKNVVCIRNMETKEQEDVARQTAIEAVKKLLGNKELKKAS
ncbi:MAG: histidine--tRNA ligase [Candidatus Omnitrophica bacterium]|nr:histidine--tRNA ligase [Candidatus Omnitrophota bacterium]